MILSDLERWDVRDLFFRRISVRTVGPTAIKFEVVTHVGEGRVCKGQPCPHPNGRGPIALKCWGTPYLRPLPLT